MSRIKDDLDDDIDIACKGSVYPMTVSVEDQMDGSSLLASHNHFIRRARFCKFKLVMPSPP
jgi:hypothetical protein